MTITLDGRLFFLSLFEITVEADTDSDEEGVEVVRSKLAVVEVGSTVAELEVDSIPAEVEEDSNLVVDNILQGGFPRKPPQGSAR